MTSSRQGSPFRSTSVARSTASVSSIASLASSIATSALSGGEMGESIPREKRARKSRRQIKEEAEFWKSQEAKKIFEEYEDALIGRKKKPRGGKNLAWIATWIEKSNGIRFSCATISRYWAKYMKAKRPPLIQVKEEVLDYDDVIGYENPRVCTHSCFHCTEGHRAPSIPSPQEPEVHCQPVSSQEEAILGSNLLTTPDRNSAPAYSFLDNLFPRGGLVTSSPLSSPFNASFMNSVNDSGDVHFGDVFNSFTNDNEGRFTENETD